MSFVIGLIAEGPTDAVVLEPLIKRAVGPERRASTWSSSRFSRET